LTGHAFLGLCVYNKEENMCNNLQVFRMTLGWLDKAIGRRGYNYFNPDDALENLTSQEECNRPTMKYIHSMSETHTAQ